MLRLLWALVLAPLGVLSADDQPSLSVQEIMGRVAANQDQGQKARAEYVYQQRIRVVARRTNGKLAREETTDYLITPTPNGTKKELKHIDGRYWHKGKYLEFHGELPQSPSPNCLPWTLDFYGLPAINFFST